MEGHEIEVFRICALVDNVLNDIKEQFYKALSDQTVVENIGLYGVELGEINNKNKIFRDAAAALP